MMSELEKTGTSAERQELTNKDLNKVVTRWMFSNTASWSYERMQNVAFAWSLAPALKKIYPDKQDFSDALTRHLVFFNTEMVGAAPILGVTLALETERAAGTGVTDEVIQSIKAGLMGPFSALFGSLYGSTLNALLLSFCISIGLEGNIAGPILYVVTWAALCILLSVWGIRYGYSQGRNVMSDSSVFSDQNIAKITRVLAVIGLTVIGGLTAGFVSLSTPITWGVDESVTALQDILDEIMPGLLPLLITMFCWYLYDRKDVSILKILGLLIVIGAVGSLIGLFG